MPFQRPCKRCNHKFLPRTRHSKLCELCLSKSQKTKNWRLKKNERLKKVRKIKGDLRYSAVKTKRFKCQKCNQSFVWELNFKKHIKLHDFKLERIIWMLLFGHLRRKGGKIVLYLLSKEPFLPPLYTNSKSGDIPMGFIRNAQYAARNWF